MAVNIESIVSLHDPDPHRTDGVYQSSGQPNPKTTELEAKVEGEEEAEWDAENIKCTAQQICWTVSTHTKELKENIPPNASNNCGHDKSKVEQQPQPDEPYPHQEGYQCYSFNRRAEICRLVCETSRLKSGRKELTGQMQPHLTQSVLDT